jgi:hypothetical protein
MKYNHNQDGFSGMALLVLLLVILAIAGIGSYLYSNRPKAVKPLATGSTSTSPSNTGTSTSPNGIPGGVATTPPPGAVTTGPDSTTVKITELGFQITVPNAIKDLTYHVNGSSVTFSTTSLTAAIPSCRAASGTGAFDIISKGNGTYKPPANSADGGLLKQYGTYYLAYTLPTGPCAKGLSVSNQNLLDDQAQAFYGALTTVL